MLRRFIRKGYLEVDEDPVHFEDLGIFSNGVAPEDIFIFVIAKDMDLFVFECSIRVFD
jgi:hypothetical protein